MPKLKYEKTIGSKNPKRIIVKNQPRRVAVKKIGQKAINKFSNFEVKIKGKSNCSNTIP